MSKNNTGLPFPISQQSLFGTSIVNNILTSSKAFTSLISSQKKTTKAPKKAFPKKNSLLPSEDNESIPHVFGYKFLIKKKLIATLVKTKKINSKFQIAVWCFDKETIDSLWTNGKYGKGILSRSEPSWANRFQKSRSKIDDNVFVEELTWKRRSERLNFVREIDSCFDGVSLEESHSMEPLQLSKVEALFLSTAIGCLDVIDDEKNVIGLESLWINILESVNTNLTWDHPILIEYVAYYYFRSCGWTVRSGVKFATDFVLYKDGPQSSHSQYAVKIVPVFPENDSKLNKPQRSGSSEIRMLHANSRICSQVKKTLLICYVHIPDISIPPKFPLTDMAEYKITQMKVFRFNPDSNR
ncbi:putative tRNA-splicing endonuclease subunit sen2 [Smittium mucronatum]|uniref:tRNA-splicing endonuclease subunit Sen2 n=1 Tax=Smittium mucronatum TaxID=133383 RepID=A0A1R0GXA1_9FUNG|nr:putative tRNA-splicing endonuclease subunit sen2 [Smittium mucronatum]